MKGSSLVHIGTSGWHYNHWRGPVYPEDLPEREMLAFYARDFRTVEINNSFYHLPAQQTFISWKETVPEDFVFAVKASRYITHRKKLKDPEEPLERFFERARSLEDKFGPVLFQLPPRWKCNVERLKTFLDSLEKGHRTAFEFRDPSWFNEEVYDALRGAEAAFCIYELAGTLSPKMVTGPFIYVRLHGPGGSYRGLYSDQTLSEWARTFSGWTLENREIFCFFDNDEAGYAVRNARRLQEMVDD